MNKFLINKVVLLCALIASQAQASLMIERYGNAATPTTVGGYEMTDFALDDTGFFTSSINSPISGILNIEDRNGNPLNMEVGSADDLAWWANNESSNHNTYTTEVHWLKILLPANTLAFSFDIGANMSAGGWLTAADSNGMGISNMNRRNIERFRVGPSYSPAYGIYADNSHATTANCSYVSSVIIDPQLVWGVGNFSIAQGDCASSVPEPSILALMSVGLIGVGFLRRKVKAK